MNHLVVGSAVGINAGQYDADIRGVAGGVGVGQPSAFAFEQGLGALAGLQRDHVGAAVDVAAPLAVDQAGQPEAFVQELGLPSGQEVGRGVADGHPGVGDLILGPLVVQDGLAVRVVNIVVAVNGSVFISFAQRHGRAVQSPDIGQGIYFGIISQAVDDILVAREIEVGFDREIPGLQRDGVEDDLEPGVGDHPFVDGDARGA